MRLIALGAEKVTGLDLGDEWIPHFRQSLEKRGFGSANVECIPGSLLQMPVPDHSYDFVSVDGVLIHLADMDSVKKGFDEAARLVKPGGFLFTSWGPCGGLVQGTIFPAIRSYYQTNLDFRNLIDNLSVDIVHSIIDKICDDALEHAKQDLGREYLKSLFGEDYCLYLMNYIQAPSWLSNECTPQFVEELYANRGFINIKRLNSYVIRTDIRKYEAPLHFDRDHPVAKVLFGEGYVKYVAQSSTSA
jgi:SAM-dependent methyltransferase